MLHLKTKQKSQNEFGIYKSHHQIKRYSKVTKRKMKKERRNIWGKRNWIGDKQTNDKNWNEPIFL